MMRVKRGSALLLVILITTFLSLLALGCWYKSSLLLDLVLQKEQYYKNFYLTESFLNYGLQLAKDRFDDFLGEDFLEKMPIILNFNLNDKIDRDLVNLSVEIRISRVKVKEKFEDKLLVSAILKNSQTLKTLCKLSCKLVKDEEYFVQNFTIGNFI